MKYLVILGDGMADTPVPELGNKTPLQVAKKPNIDKLAKDGLVGLVKTVPTGIAPGSDPANLSVMGYNPKIYYTGRSPLEAVSMGIDMLDTDVAIRCNVVTLSNDEIYENKTMIDYSSDEISTSEARELIKAVQAELGNDIFTFYGGISYRHCMIWKEGPLGFNCTPPHDITGKKITEYLPKGEAGKVLLDLMKKSCKILESHPVNLARIEKGLNPATSIWLWGEGKKPNLASFKEKYGLNGTVISAVDLIKGIGLCAGLDSIDVEGATGNIHTNFTGKAEAAIKAFKDGSDFIYLHIEAPDECGHRYEIDNKVKSIEIIDEKVVGPILNALEGIGDYCVMVLPDHPTPLALRTHTSDPVPFIIYRKGNEPKTSVNSYDEFEAASTKVYVEEGYTLMDIFLKGDRI